MRISDLLRGKSAPGGTDAVTTSAESSVRDLLAVLAQYDIGALVVVDAEQVIGVVSERDVVRRLNDHGAGLLDARVREIMSAPAFTCTPDDDVDTVAETMTERRIRHVPVLAGAGLVGVVSIGDVVKSRIQQLEVDRDQLEQYITG